jgi:uncharacterized protein with HEPN domain
MLRDDFVFLNHIVDAARKAISFTANRTRDELDTNEMLALSLIRLLEVIGEAANQVSLDLKERHPAIPWEKMVGMRNRLIHGYFDINLDILWDTVSKDLPPLIEQIQQIIPNDKAGS